MKKLKENWLFAIIGIHIAFRIVLSVFVTNDEVNIAEYKATMEFENSDEELAGQQIVLLD